jgi:Holliday junction resolvase RusA-like endonuclease
MVGPVRIIVSVSWPDRRRRDVPNVWPTVKACVDGCVDAEVIADDDDSHVESMTFRRAPELSGVAQTARIALTFEEVGAC